MTLNTNRADRFKRYVPVNPSFEYFNNPMPFIPLFNDLSVSQFRTGHEFGSTGSAPFPCAGIGRKDTMSTFDSLPVRIQSITDPYRPTPLSKTSLCFSNKRFTQGRFGAVDPKRDHQPIFFGKGNPNPDFSFQSIARSRSEVFLTNDHNASNSIWDTYSPFR